MITAGANCGFKLESGVVFRLGLWGAAAARVEGAERGPRLGSIGIERLGGDELACGALEPCTVGRRLVCGWSRGQQRNGPEAYAPIGVGQQR